MWLRLVLRQVGRAMTAGEPEVKAPQDERHSRSAALSPRAGKRWWALAVSAVFAGSLAGVSITRLASPPPLQGGSHPVFTTSPGTFSGPTAHPQVAAAWSLPDLHAPSTTVTLAQFHGHPLVVNFWASWCIPCRLEMPALAATARQLHGTVAFVGIDTKDSRQAALAFARTTGVHYPLGFDPGGNVAQLYGVFGLPTTFFVSPQGAILGHQIGGLTEPRLKQLIAQTFGIRAGTEGPVAK